MENKKSYFLFLFNQFPRATKRFDSVLTSCYTENAVENPYNLVVQLLDSIENKRTKDVLFRRFGLVSGRPATLQEIGDHYDITRERVRQIEKNGLDAMSWPKIREKLTPINGEFYQLSAESG